MTTFITALCYFLIILGANQRNIDKHPLLVYACFEKHFKNSMRNILQLSTVKLNEEKLNKTQSYVIINISVPVVTSTNSVTDSLYSHLFTNYKEKLIPVCTPGGKVDVFFGTALRQMMNLVLHLFLLDIFMKFDSFNFSQKKESKKRMLFDFTLLKL